MKYPNFSLRDGDTCIDSLSKPEPAEPEKGFGLSRDKGLRWECCIAWDGCFFVQLKPK
jgi:hypothetical protein